MRIAIILSGIAGKSGTERQALSLASALKREGHHVDLFCYWHSPDKCYTELVKGFDVHYVKLLKEEKRAEKPAGRKFLPEKIRYFGRIYFPLIKKILFTEKPLKELKELMEKTNPLSFYDVLNLHEYEICGIARILRHPNIVCMLNDAGHTISRGKHPIHNFFYNILQRIYNRLIFRNIKKITVLNEGSVKICQESYGLTPTVVRSGIDIQIFKDFPATREFPPKTLKIFASGIFSPHRRFEDLADAIEIVRDKGVKNIEAEINGKHDRHHEYYLFIQERIRQKKLDGYIKITSGMSEEELRRKIRDSHIFVFPNINQTWGLAVFEAMLGGCVPIVNREAGASEILTDNKNALLVNPLSPREIADKIIYLAENPQVLQKISEEAPKFVKENLSWEKYAEAMLKAFK